MYYFGFLALVLGSLLVTAAPFMVIPEKKWRRFVLEVCFVPRFSLFESGRCGYPGLSRRHRMIHESHGKSALCAASAPSPFPVRRHQERIFLTVPVLTSWCLGLVILAPGVFSL